MPKKKKRAETLFGERMEREGRGQEYRDKVREVMSRTGQRWGQGRWEAMRALGYVDGPTEHALHKEFLESERGRLIRDEEEEIADEAADFEKKLRDLPDAPPGGDAENVAWVRAHPAMLRRARAQENEFVVLRLRDLYNAPSKVAVTMLQWYINNPDDFFKQIMSELKKKADSTGDGQTAKGGLADAGLDEIHRMLDGVATKPITEAAA